MCSFGGDQTDFRVYTRPAEGGKSYADLDVQVSGCTRSAEGGRSFADVDVQVTAFMVLMWCRQGAIMLCKQGTNQLPVQVLPLRAAHQRTWMGAFSADQFSAEACPPNRRYCAEGCHLLRVHPK